MNAAFQKAVSGLPEKCRALLACAPMAVSALPSQAGIYLLSEGDTHLYVGRTGNIRKRVNQHTTGTHNQAAFAFKLAREATGRVEASYTPEGSRDHLMQDAGFAQAFSAAKQRVGGMQVRYVIEADDVQQSLLEIYAALEFDTKYNSWATT